MKRLNKIIYFPFLVLTIILGIDTVKAWDGLTMNDALNETILCHYESNINVERKVTIYYLPESNSYSIYYYYKNFLSDSDEMSMDDDNLYFSESARKSLDSGKCPKSAYLDVDAFNEVCFDDGGGHCEDEEGFEKLERLSKEYNGYEEREEVLKTYAKNISFDDKSCLEYTQSKDKVLELINNELQKIVEHETEDYPVAFREKMKVSFRDTYADIIYENSYTNFANRCKAEIEQSVNQGTMTSEEANQRNENLDITKEETKENIDEMVDNGYSDKQKYGGRRICDIFGEGTWDYIQGFYKLIKILIPALIIVLGMLDFMKVVFSGEEKDMKTSGTRFLKRIIAGVIFILLPILLEFVIDLVGFSENCLDELAKISL